MDWSEWANLLIRWFHLIAGVSWIGQTWLFNWMEKTFTPPDLAAGKPNISGELWMMHGGGFYLVEKQKVPEIMPRELHWFGWESALTWMSGVALMAVVYYMGGLMVEPDAGLSEGAAVALSLGLVVCAWPVYELLWKIPLFKNNEALGAAAGLGLILAAAEGLSRVFSSRAAFFHVGALMGTIMAANVWITILPGMRRMIAAVKAGQKPDMEDGARGKRASKHNTYMSVPLLLIMVSNHFPTTLYGAEHSTAVMGVLVLAGWGAAKFMRG